MAEDSWEPGQALRGIAELDVDRAARRGYPEAVYCEGKTPEQVAAIAAEIHSQGLRTLFTRAAPEHATAVRRHLADAAYDPAARLLAWPPEPPPPTGGRVLVVCAGTSDLPVAREALLVARHLGRRAHLVVDVGVAGLHRVLSHLEELRSARAIVVVAGMDGALPSVVAGLVTAPVVAVPTSVGYGAAFDGLAALLTMLNSCAPGVAVVNIDNGYGAGHLAAQISATGGRAEERPPRVVVSGVSGSGKSTVGHALAARLGISFADGDDLHPALNVSKMRSGVPLSDEDRLPWLHSVAAWLGAQPGGGVVACSALTRAHRDGLRAGCPDVWFAQLTAPEELIKARQGARTGHFMPASLMTSQLALLEPLALGEHGAVIDVSGTPDGTVAQILEALEEVAGSH